VHSTRDGATWSVLRTALADAAFVSSGPATSLAVPQAARRKAVATTALK
jgi:hypothetical protein